MARRSFNHLTKSLELSSFCLNPVYEPLSKLLSSRSTLLPLKFAMKWESQREKWRSSVRSACSRQMSQLLTDRALGWVGRYLSMSQLDQVDLEMDVLDLSQYQVVVGTKAF